MIHRMVKYKVKEEKEAGVRQAIDDFVSATKENITEGVAINIYAEKDGLTFYHISAFENEELLKQHEDSASLADFWEILYESCESFSQFVELNLVASINKY
jgi:quinol monooxygenase YgiN